MKPTIAQQFGHPSTLREGPFPCKGFKKNWNKKIPAKMELTSEQQQWFDGPHARPLPLAFGQ